MNELNLLIKIEGNSKEEQRKIKLDVPKEPPDHGNSHLIIITL